MSQVAFYCLVLIVICTSLVSARSNYCLAEGNIVYKPLQLYPADCPGHTNDCMSYVYNYSAPLFKSKSVATILPKNRESLVYISQDESDNLDVVVITATTYTNTVINTQIKAVGASPADILVKDDPTEDTWFWDAANNYGNFSWLLQPSYTDGLVLGHLKIVDNFCLTVTFTPNWVGAITNISLLTGTTKKTSRVYSKSLSTVKGASTSLEFCLYPQIKVTKTDASCGSLGSASAMSLNYTASATYKWAKDGVVFSTASSVDNLQPGTYVLTITVNGCDAVRNVTIESSANTIAYSYVAVPATFSGPGRVDLSVSGGYPPYTITWRKSDGAIVATNVLTYNSQGGSYNITITDGCNDVTFTVVVPAPTPCAAGSRVNSTGSCELCPAGTYSETTNSQTCTVCPPGSRNNLPGSISCSSCPANEVNNGGSDECTPCPQNTFSAAGSATCKPCPLGTDRPSTSSSCSSCDDGEYRCSATGLCSACDAGTFGTNGKTSCELCNPGTYQPNDGRSSCLICPADTYAAAGATSCTACPHGTTAPAGSSVLIACM